MTKIKVSSARHVGFTLIELLVALGVTALLVSMMLTIVVNVMGGWNRSSGSLSSGNQARMILDIMGRDIQSAIMKRNGDVWFAATIQANGVGDAWSNSSKPTTVRLPSIPAVGDPLPSLEDEYTFGQAGVWLRFIASIPGTNTGTDLSAPRAVSYQIKRRSVSGASAEQGYMLYRSEVSSADTFNNGYNLYNNVYYNGLLKDPGATDVIANNVVDFGIRCLKRNAAGQLVLIFPDSVDGSPTASFAATSDTAKVGQGAAEAAPVRDFPSVVEIYVRILTEEGAQLAANLEANVITTPTWDDIVSQHSRVYTRRIEIKGTSL